MIVTINGKYVIARPNRMMFNASPVYGPSNIGQKK